MVCKSLKLVNHSSPAQLVAVSPSNLGFSWPSCGPQDVSYCCLAALSTCVDFSGAPCHNIDLLGSAGEEVV
jgi:hypothetical protein